MFKTKFFSGYKQYRLEDEVNKFIKNKKVVNVSYSVIPSGYESWHYCCVLYEERGKLNEMVF